MKRRIRKCQAWDCPATAVWLKIDRWWIDGLETVEFKPLCPEHAERVRRRYGNQSGMASTEGESMRLIRVFPRRTKASPDDILAYFGPPDLFAQADEVHIDCTFTYDKPTAEWLAEQWKHVAPVKVGGVAYGDPGAEFISGRYIKNGYTFTSRGCPRRCWFCSVWRRDSIPRLLPIRDGWNILDDNLLACPEFHVRAVFAMLAGQSRRVEFTGGLEAAALQDYQVDLLASLKPQPVMFWAYDPGDEFETLEFAARRLIAAGLRQDRHSLRCYVLIGYPKDTLALAQARLEQVLSLGFDPMAMLWRPEHESQLKYMPGQDWRRFQRKWARPAIIHGTRSYGSQSEWRELRCGSKSKPQSRV